MVNTLDCAVEGGSKLDPGAGELRCDEDREFEDFAVEPCPDKITER